MRGKRGEQEGPALMTYIIVFALLVLAVVVISYLYTTLKKQTGAIAPEVLDTLVLGCNSAAATNALTFFCGFKDATDSAGKIQYINCEYSKLKSRLDNPITCPVDTEQKECVNLKAEGKDMTKTMVNGNLCPA